MYESSTYKVAHIRYVVVNLEILYIIPFEPATIRNPVVRLGFSLDVFIVVGVVLRSGVILFQLREKIFAFIKD